MRSDSISNEVSGDAVFAALYAEHHDRVLKYLARTVGSDEAEDCAQEVFVRAFAGLSAFKGQAGSFTWLYRIATNLLIDRSRRKGHIVDRCNLIDKALFCNVHPEYLSAEFDLVHNEMKECICSYMKALPAGYRAILVMKEYESLSVAEIAEVLEITPENAKRRLSRARARLKQILVEQCLSYYTESNQLACEKS